MSLPRPFSQCSLSDLAPAISADASTASARALDPATASRLLPALRNAALTEAVLLRHPLVRDRSGLKCDGSVYSKRAWCGMLRDLAGAAGVDASDAALTRVYLVCKECAMQGGVHVSAELPPSAPSFKFEYDDRFLGRLMRIPPAQLRQVDAPLQLMHALSFHFSRSLAPRTELRQPPPPLRHTQVALWPAQRARIMPGVVMMTCHRFSTAAASFNVYSRTASSCKALCLSRVMSGHFGRLQVRAFVPYGAVFVFIIDACCSTFGWEARRQQLPHLSPPPPPPPPPPPHCFRISQAAAAARIKKKPTVVEAAASGNIGLVMDHVVADARCVHKAGF
jgi:hypothetical protein